MKLLLFLSYFLFFLSFLYPTHAIPLPADEDKIPSANLIFDRVERSYVMNGVLTHGDEVIILDLAKKQGIEKVAKISTHYILPTSFKAIQVEGMIEREGREVSTKTLSITRKDWAFPNAKPGMNDLTQGDFWASKVYVRKQVELYVDGNSYLCNSVQGLSFEEAEILLGIFLNKQFGISSGVRQTALAQVDWNRPTRFGKREGNISVGFLTKGKGGGFFNLIVKKENGALIIQQMMQAIP